MYSSLPLERFVQVGVRMSLYYALCLCEFRIHAGVRLNMCVPIHVYSSLRFVQVGVRLSLYYALCLCEFRIHAGVRLSMCVPVHVYSSLPPEFKIRFKICVATMA